MRLRSLITSTVFHIIVVLLMTVGIAFTPKRDITLPPPITVEFAKIDKETKTPTPVVKPPPKPAEKKPPEPPKVKEPPKPKPAPTNTSETPVVPADKPEKETPPPEQEAQVKPAPKPDLKKEQPPKPEQETNKKAAEKQPEPEKEKKPEKDAKPQRDFGSVLKNLAESEPETQAEIAEEDAPAFGQQAPLGAQLTVSELDALRRQLGECWSLPIGARDVENIVVDVNVIVGQDKVVQQAGIIDTARYNNDTFYRAVADSAVRAVYSPSCSPLKVPDGKYDLWKNMIIEFNPKDMF